MKLNLSGTTLIQQLILQIITGLIVAANTGIVKAQLTPDNTVGSTTRSDTVKGLTSDIIEGGATRGTNLFHSFTNFNVDAGKGVYFSNPADINNILTRVTGSSQSNIFGTLGVLGNANLFLINPNGISFGPNAQLDVKGSFVASTADKIVFDNYEFTTTNPTAPPLLTVNIPLGLGFRNNPGDINVNLAGSTLAFNNGQGLKVPQDKTLALIGGNVNINGNGVDAEGLRAGILSPGSQIQLGGLTQTGTVNFNENFYSTFPQGVTRGNVSLSNGAEINVRAAGGGSITINSRNLNVNENSRVRGGIQKNLGSVNAQAGNIDINNIEQVTLDNAVIANIVDEFGKGNAGNINIHTSSLTLKNDSTINTSVFAASSEGNGGNITIDTANLTLENGNFISADTNGKGNAGNVAIKATQGVTVGEKAVLSSDVNDTAQGNSGGITIDTATLTLENGSFIGADTRGKGNAGSVAIKATQGVNVRGWLSSDVKGTAQGNSGGITIDTSTLTLENGGFISADTRGKGNAGSVAIKATQGVTVGEKALLSSDVTDTAQGNGGNVTIDTSTLTLKNGGFISADTKGKGNAGNVAIQANQGVTVGGFLSSGVTDTGEGNGGGITIDTSSLTLENGGIISTSILGKGDAGNITINATQGVNVRGGLSSGVFNTGEGNSGDITITTPTLNLENGGIISTSILGKGDAGNITINAIQGVTVGGLLTSGVFSTIETIDRNSGGKVTINTSTLTVENGGSINASTYGKGDAGNIAIKATQGVNVRGELTSDVKNTAQGNSGGINIDTSTLTLKNGGLINASTYGKGNAGNIAIQATQGVTVGGLLSSGVTATGEGNSGGITIDTSSLTLENGGFINASTFGKGNAGNIAIQATQGVNVGGLLTSGVTDTGVGNSGGITIDTSTLTLENGGFINASTSGKGNAGDIVISAYQGVTIGGYLSSGVFSTGEGNSGGITIKAGDINIKGVGDNNITSQINTTTSGKGNAGDINISASNITIDQGVVYSSALGDGEGKGGNININTSNLTLKNGYISTETTSKGDAGNIQLGITDNLKLTNSTISSGTDSTGKAGSINIDPKFYYNSCIVGGCVTIFISEYNVSTLIELDSSQITVNSQGSADGGNITLIGNNLNLNNSTISASTKSGQGGNITLNIPDTIRQNNSQIEASAGDKGNGGNVTINTNFIIGNSSENRISANAKQGAGGNIKITTQGIFGYKDNQIDASSETGVNGVVETKTPEVDPSQGLIDLPENLLTAAIITNSCRQGQNSLIVKGRGGLALTSDQLPSSSEVEVSLIASTSVKSSSAINPTSANIEKTAFKTIIPAQGWEINSQGDVVLVGHSTGNPAERVNTAITCASN
ncbi:MAG: S-layer family protein [Dolichospermum sp. DET50]|nr:S-layer family protein [Dolichospermum sp. DET66]MBS3031116.1 S-layer family protein [Dolichospermum sp. DET67]MBS3036326.1 S-layer family protein [Dolichospermum sp. DET50]QSX68387.1 MAG: S-layer family protein [Dolichospermum sp. DET69]